MTTTRKKLPIRYWQGMNTKHVLADLTQEDKQKLKALIAGDYKNLSLEKLQNANIYSIRINIERRILFTTIEVQGRHIALILEILPNHGYDRSMCLNRQVLKQFLTRKQADNVNLGNIEFSPVAGIDNFNTDETTADDAEVDLELLECDYSNGRCLLFSEEQAELQRELKSPCLIKGLGGSGKTTVVNSIIHRLIEEYHAAGTVPELPILYVTECTPLVAVQQAQWNAHPLSQTAAGAQVQFLTTADAIALYSTAVRVKRLRAVLDDELKKRVTAAIHKVTHKEFEVNADNINNIMHEFEIMAACHLKPAYDKLGKAQSYYPKAQRNQLWEAFLEIKKQLETDKCYSPRLYREIHAEKDKQLFWTIVDEAHTGSRVAKFNLRHLSQNFIACADSLQSTEKNISDVPYLLANLGNETNTPANVYHLTQSFRNPLRVLLLTEFLNKMRRYIIGGVGDSTESTKFVNASINANNIGRIRYIESAKLNQLTDELNTARQDVAIITRKEHLSSAATKFGNQQVFTPTQIGGLEYDNIIIDDTFFDDHRLASLYGVLEHYTLDTPVNTNKPKQASEYRDAMDFLNQFNTAITRPRKRLYIIGNTPNSRARRFYELLTLFINTANATYKTEGEEQADLKAASSVKEWEARIEQLVANQQFEVAKSIWVKDLKRPEKSFYEKYNDSTQQKPATNIQRTGSVTPKTVSHLKKFLNSNAKNKTTSILEMLDTTEGQTILSNVNEPFYLDKINPLLMTVLNATQLFDIYKTDESIIFQESAFIWLLTNRHRAFVLNKYASENPTIMRKCLNEIARYTKEYGPMVLSEENGALIPIYMLVALNCYDIFIRLLSENPSDVKAVLSDYWAYRVISNRTFLAYLADTSSMRNEDIDTLKDISLTEEVFFDEQGQLNLDTIDALIVSPQGAEILYRCLYINASFETKCILESDEFMLTGIINLKQTVSNTRIGFLLEHYNSVEPWVKAYLLYQPNFSDFISKEITICNFSLTLAEHLFSFRAFNAMLIDHYTSVPEAANQMLAGYNFAKQMNGSRLLIQLLAKNSGRSLLKLLFRELSTGLFPAESELGLMREMLAQRHTSIAVQSVMSDLAYDYPSVLDGLISKHPNLVRFITRVDFAAKVYDGVSLMQKCLLTPVPIQQDSCYLLWSLASACDFHLIKIIPFREWMLDDHISFFLQ